MVGFVSAWRHLVKGNSRGEQKIVGPPFPYSHTTPIPKSHKKYGKAYGKDVSLVGAPLEKSLTRAILPNPDESGGSEISTIQTVHTFHCHHLPYQVKSYRSHSIPSRAI